MPNGEGIPQLVDLQEPVDEALLRNIGRNGANNAYWLYTRYTTPTYLSKKIIILDLSTAKSLDLDR